MIYEADCDHAFLPRYTATSSTIGYQTIKAPPNQSTLVFPQLTLVFPQLPLGQCTWPISDTLQGKSMPWLPGAISSPPM